MHSQHCSVCYLCILVLRIYLWVKNEGEESEVFLCFCELPRVGRPGPSPRLPRRVTILRTTSPLLSYCKQQGVQLTEAELACSAATEKGREGRCGQGPLNSQPTLLQRESSPRTKGRYNRFQEQSREWLGQQRITYESASAGHGKLNKDFLCFYLRFIIEGFL